ncbi:aminotransferase class I/II-fold pyridoxal phosphate-dependent enzyme [Mucilaginibacter corticis]|uniref:Aminotransferase class I/II-fold pyridoxal phosphate-dependent enzyme n=1 Tax=Mucilaginibacter corticis TaxID=2597670 RepID=A0A556M9S6_9SPHI|nr:aminotransferase class I/II-fold pyridoxal phosphate-dependent enzyme [Mucilaginibacter corticis]TSJ36565.1 aminotransferase class I/II-fold pyridoxal phosphate-dependent enzyme [Mucilaginibacter corticis]
MKQNFDNNSFRDFEYIAGMDAWARAKLFQAYLDDQTLKHQLNYRLQVDSGCGPVISMNGQRLISLVSNDYLGFTQHPAVIKAAVDGINKYGTGAGASPAIGGHYDYIEQLEKAIAKFFRKEHAIIYTTGYTSNSASLQAILTRDDLVIMDSGVHTSVMEGCQCFNRKTVKHNDLNAYEHVLKMAGKKHPLVLVIIDGVYSQDGDLAPLREIIGLCKKYGAKLMVDDAHGTGVIGKTGRGLIEVCDAWNDVDLITGTFSKTFGHIGGYVVGSKEMVNYLKYQSKQHLFSASLSPAALSIVKAIELIDEEPLWMSVLKDNCKYFRHGLQQLGLNIGNTQSAIFPVRVGDKIKNAKICYALQQKGVYANQINYPAVSMKDARIRMGITARHSKAQMDEVLNIWSDIKREFSL